MTEVRHVDASESERGIDREFRDRLELGDWCPDLACILDTQDFLWSLVWSSPLLHPPASRMTKESGLEFPPQAAS